MAIIRRKMFEDIRKHLAKPEIILLVGARQVGKTTILKEIEKELKAKNQTTLWLSLDYEADNRFFSSQDKLLDKIKLECGSGPAYIFIDEIQRKENAGLFLKGLYDLNLPYKFLVSGSGSLELKEKIHESLAGRKIMLELKPVSLEEFIDFRTDYKYSDHLIEFLKLEVDQVKRLLEEYLSFGGYPKVILTDQAEEKLEVIKEIYTSYLEKDISYLLGLEKSSIFSDLLRILAGLNGQILNYSKIAAQIGVSFQTLKKYLYYAEKTFIIHRSRPFSLNSKKEIVKSSLIYFNDLGLRNFSVGHFNSNNNSKELSFLFQNLIINILQTKITPLGLEVFFWRTIDGAEVDGIIKYGSKIIAVEIKYSDLKKPAVSRSLQNFIIKYQPTETLIINLSLVAKRKINNTVIQFLTLAELLSKSIIKN